MQHGNCVAIKEIVNYEFLTLNLESCKKRIGAFLMEL